MSGALDASSAVPTPSGWRDLSELGVGDQVFGADGLPCRITGVDPVGPFECEAVELRLCDGSSLACSTDQRWLVRVGGEASLLETSEIAPLVRAPEGQRVSMALPAPLEHCYRELGRDPYTEGARIGGGLIEEAHGISRSYLEADVIQRRELLMGLLDEGGGVTASGAVHFDTLHQHLARDVCELVRSLGYRATLSCGGGPRGRYKRVSFRTTDEVFGLREPAEQLRGRASDLDDPRFIVGVWEVGWRPMRAVEVDSGGHLLVLSDGLLVVPDGSGCWAGCVTGGSADLRTGR